MAAYRGKMMQSELEDRRLLGMPGCGDFDITIPVKESIDEVIVKTKMGEWSVWNVHYV